jgi:hypothetical protein
VWEKEVPPFETVLVIRKNPGARVVLPVSQKERRKRTWPLVIAKWFKLRAVPSVVASTLLPPIRQDGLSVGSAHLLGHT